MQIRDSDWYEVQDPERPGHFLVVGSGYSGGNDGIEWVSPSEYEARVERAEDRGVVETSRVEGQTAPALPDESTPAGSLGTDRERGITDALRRLEPWVPTEALGAYVTIFALADPDTALSKAAILVVAVVLTAFLTWYQFTKDDRRIRSHQLGARALAGRMIIYVIAITVYVSALPANVFTEFDGFNIRIGGIVAIVAAIVLPRIADLSGIPTPGQPVGSK